jgi:type I restriction enzyme M protein
MKLFDRREDVEHVAKSVRMEKITENDYNLSVSSYVEAKDTREAINITKLNQEIEATVTKINGLRKDIDAIVAKIEGSEA